MDSSVLSPGKAPALYEVFEDAFFPFLVESGPHFQNKNKPWLEKITKALSQKVTQACREHLHSTAGAEMGACGAIPPPLQFLQSKQAKMCTRGDSVSCHSLLSAAGYRQSGLHIL